MHIQQGLILIACLEDGAKLGLARFEPGGALPDAMLETLVQSS